MVTITIACKNEEIKESGDFSGNSITFCDSAKNLSPGKTSLRKIVKRKRTARNRLPAFGEGYCRPCS